MAEKILVDVDLYLSEVRRCAAGEPPKWAEGYFERDDRIDQAIRHLVASLGLEEGQTLLSVGAGRLQEEVKFSRSGLSVTAIDNLSDWPGLAEALGRCRARPTSNDVIEYIITDALGGESHPFGHVFDAVYLSGFYPDEWRRGQTKRRIDSHAPFGLGRLSLRAWHRAGPFHPGLLNLAKSHLSEGGLLVIQSYAFGVAFDDYFDYLSACADSLGSEGFTLHQVSRRAGSNALLYVAERTTTSRPRRTVRPVAFFHGRGNGGGAASTIYPSRTVLTPWFKPPLRWAARSVRALVARVIR